MNNQLQYNKKTLSFKITRIEKQKIIKVEKPKIETQKEAFINALEKMDIDKINKILDDSITYQNFSKSHFVNLLKIALQKMKANGDTELLSTGGNCNGCNKCDSGLSFVGNNTCDYFDLIVKSADGKINDIFECSRFLNEDKYLLKKKQIDIDSIFDRPLYDEPSNEPYDDVPF